VRLGSMGGAESTPGSAVYRSALQTARRSLLALRDSGDIGDDASHTLENELGWMEVSDPLRGANAEKI